MVAKIILRVDLDSGHAIAATVDRQCLPRSVHARGFQGKDEPFILVRCLVRWRDWSGANLSPTLIDVALSPSKKVKQDYEKVGTSRISNEHCVARDDSGGARQTSSQQREAASGRAATAAGRSGCPTASDGLPGRLC